MWCRHKESQLMKKIIMAVPKRKTTKSRSGKRRSHIKFTTKNLFKAETKILKYYSAQNQNVSQK